MAEQMRDASEHLPVLYGLTFLIAPFLIGLALAPAAFAYRALTDARARLRVLTHHLAGTRGSYNHRGGAPRLTGCAIGERS